jgi:hypothetical protein
MIKVPFTQLEANVCQTVASAAGSMTTAAGLIGPIPALQMLGMRYTVPTIMLWGLSAGPRNNCNATLASPTLHSRHTAPQRALCMTPQRAAKRRKALFPFAKNHLHIQYPTPLES